MRPRSLLPILAILASCAPVAHAADTATLLVRGRVTGPEGWPVAGVPVTVTGTLAAPATTDGQGGYALYVPLPSLAAVARTPLAVRIAPVRDGWSFVRDGGHGVAGLEVEVVGPPARLRVRAPSVAFANAVVTALTGKGATMAFADLDFTGAPGAAAAAAPEMLAEASVPVSGVKVERHAARAASAPAGSPVDDARAAAPRRADGARDSLRAAAAAERRAEAARADSLKVAAAAERRAERLRADSARAEARRAPPALPTPRVAPPVAPRLATVAPTPAWVNAKAREDSARAARLRVAIAYDDSVRAVRDAERAFAQRVERARRDSLAALARVRRDSTAAAQRAAHEAWVRAWQQRQDSLAAARRPRASAPPPPLLVSVRDSVPPPAPAPPAPPDSCACTIKGTIEARSERRIPEYLKVLVWLAERPTVRDSVELFMGSPRAFEMRGPCGAHRLALSVEPRLARWTAEPAEAFQGFTCEPPRPSQWRLTLVVR